MSHLLVVAQVFRRGQRVPTLIRGIVNNLFHRAVLRVGGAGSAGIILNSAAYLGKIRWR